LTIMGISTFLKRNSQSKHIDTKSGDSGHFCITAYNLEQEWDEADSETFEQVMYEVAEKLGVEII
jgi:hypothetical protein